MEFTIFTPTYNRAYTIKTLYDSLKQQTFRDFEWIVIDDGSTDNTQQLFDDINNDTHDFPITYLRTENQGKHCAVNRAVDMALGRLFFIVDSDDSLPGDSLEIIEKYEKSISSEEIELFAGVAGLRGSKDGSILGTTFEGDYLDVTYLDAPSQNIYGDKAEVYYTKILKKYPFPQFENEKFIPESTVWNVIASDGYKLRYFNTIVYFGAYLEDGLTRQGKEKYKDIPKGYGLYLSQLVEYGQVKKLKKWELLFNYYRMFNERLSNREMAKNLNMNFMWFYFRMLGVRLFYKLYNK